MPHTSWKKKPPARQRMQVVDNDGWTHVLHGPKQDRFEKDLMTDGSLQPTDIPQGLTLDKWLPTLEKSRQEWLTSDCAKDMARFLGKDMLPIDSLRLDRVVCLGLGSPTGIRVNSYDGARVSCSQLAALEQWLQILRQRFDIKEVFLQDPSFNALDIEYFESKGYTTLSDPDAYGKVSSTTFLYCPCAEMPIISKALERRYPDLYVGNNLDRSHLPASIGEVGAHHEDVFEPFLHARRVKKLLEFEPRKWSGACVVNYPLPDP